jgi:acetyl esterase/lipase
MRERTFTAVLSLAVFAAAALGQTRPDAGRRQDPDWLKELAPKRIVYAVPGMRRVVARKNLTYKRVAGVELKMDVYAPPGPTRGARRPAVFFIHGGRIPPNLLTTPKDWGVYISFGQLVAASGFVGVTFNHRFYTWESLHDSEADVADAVSYVREHADELGVDKDRVVLWAVSAGGIFLSRPLRDAPPYVRCMVGYYPQLDLQGERASAPASVSDETLREFSPVYHLGRSSQKVPPIFIARAGLDAAGLNAGVDRFVQAALGRNVTLDLVNHATGHHGFDVEDDNDRSREIIAQTIAFIRTHCVRPGGAPD